MSLIVLYLCTSLQVWCLCVYYFTRYNHLCILCDIWSSVFVKVTCTLIIRCILCCWMFVPKNEVWRFSRIWNIWTFVWKKLKWHHYDVIWFQWNSHTNMQIAYVNGIPNFSLIRHDRAEIYSRDVNRKLWRKNGYWVTVTLTFDPRSPISIGFVPML